MGLSLAESQAVNEVAAHLYDFLPGKPHPYAEQRISFKGVAYHIGVGQFWTDGSKLPALATLLERTLESRRDRFCDLIVGIVHASLIYRRNKQNPLNREEMKRLNELLLKVQFKIPDLVDPSFLDSLPSIHKITESHVKDKLKESERLLQELMVLTKLKPQERGFAFEKFLNDLFTVNGLTPRESFRLRGEQIDGSFQMAQDLYLVEAKWHDKQIGQAELLVFHGKIGGKSTWSRGLYVSNSGFSDDGLFAYSHGRATNMIGMNGQDIYFILSGEITLNEAIERKARWAAETGDFFMSIYNLMRQGRH